MTWSSPEMLIYKTNSDGNIDENQKEGRVIFNQLMFRRGASFIAKNNKN